MTTFQAVAESCFESDEARPLVVLRLRVSPTGLEVPVNLVGEGFPSGLAERLGMEEFPNHDFKEVKE